MAVGAVAEMVIRSFVRTALRWLVPFSSLDQKDVVRSAISHEQISSGKNDCFLMSLSSCITAGLCDVS